jgi:hypothetical protein
MNAGQINKSKKLDEYCIIPNAVLQDKNISMIGKSLLGYLLSLPSDWVVYKTELPNNFKEGKHTVYKAFEELVELGYILKVPIFTGNLKSGYNYIVYSERHPEGVDSIDSSRKAEIRTSEARKYDSQQLQKKHSTKETTTKETYNSESKDSGVFSLHDSCIKFWCEVIKPDYVFGGKDAKHIKDLYGKIKASVLRKKNVDNVPNEEVFEAFKLFCSNIKNIDPFYHTLELSGVNSSYNSIHEKIKLYFNQNKNNSQSNSEIYSKELTEKDFPSLSQYESYLKTKNRRNEK